MLTLERFVDVVDLVLLRHVEAHQLGHGTNGLDLRPQRSNDDVRMFGSALAFCARTVDPRDRVAVLDDLPERGRRQGSHLRVLPNILLDELARLSGVAFDGRYGDAPLGR